MIKMVLTDECWLQTWYSLLFLAFNNGGLLNRQTNPSLSIKQEKKLIVNKHKNST